MGSLRAQDVAEFLKVLIEKRCTAIVQFDSTEMVSPKSGFADAYIPNLLVQPSPKHDRYGEPLQPHRSLDAVTLLP